MASRLARRRCPRHSNFGSSALLSALRVGTTSGGLPVPRSHKFAAALACARGTCPRSRSMASHLARRRCPRHSNFGSSAAPLSASLAGTTSGDLPVARSHKFAAALACAPCFFSNTNVKESCPHHKQRFLPAFGKKIRRCTIICTIQRPVTWNIPHMEPLAAQVDDGVPVMGVLIKD